MGIIDYLIVGSYIVFSLLVGIFTSRKAQTDTKSFFTASSDMPWWLLGTSIAATTFAADTPLAVTEIVRTDGISGNWLWWNMVFSHILLAVLFARLWRRSNIITDAEYLELRYSGKSAAVLRGVKAFYLSVLINALTMGWVMHAMAKVISVILPENLMNSLPFASFLNDIWPGFFAVNWQEGIIIFLLALTAWIYSALSGIRGVIITDFVQFIIAMGGSIMLVVFMVINDAPRKALSSLPDMQRDYLSVFPSVSSTLFTSGVFFSWIGLQWWANKYSDGGGYIVQRISSARNDNDASKAVLLFVVLHYFIRPWPWIIVALMSIPLLGNITDHQLAYPILMKTWLPSGALGLMITAFFAAFMSTIDTHINWGSSYIIEDLYRRFINPKKSEKHYVRGAALSGFIILVAGIFAALFMKSVATAWKILFLLGAGLGPVVLMRWFWWRINATSELSALFASTVTAGILIIGDINLNFGARLMTVTLISTFFAMIGTFFGEQNDPQKLKEFFVRVRPPGPFWKKISCEKSDINLYRVLFSWISGSSAAVFLFASVSEIFKGSFLYSCIFISLATLLIFLFSENYKKIIRS
ncbi:MAG: Na+:solute symporter [Deltaproteobacteria bacterium]|nr:Na+:solute symporter [Deltaproteobacteria bacterium]